MSFYQFPSTVTVTDRACISTPPLFQALAKVVSEGDLFPETDVDKHVARLFLLDFLQARV